MYILQQTCYCCHHDLVVLCIFKGLGGVIEPCESPLQQPQTLLLHSNLKTKIVMHTGGRNCSTNNVLKQSGTVLNLFHITGFWTPSPPELDCKSPLLVSPLSVLADIK